MRSALLFRRWSWVSAGVAVSQAGLAILEAHTVQRDVEAYSTLRNPLADAVTGTLLDSGYQSSVVDDAVEDLALRRFRCDYSGIGLRGARWKCTATHSGQRALRVAVNVYL